MLRGSYFFVELFRAAGFVARDVAAFFAAGLAAARLRAGFFSSSAVADVSATTGSGFDSSTGSGSAAATPIELDSVRWHVSQVTIVRTSVPS